MLVLSANKDTDQDNQSGVKNVLQYIYICIDVKLLIVVNSVLSAWVNARKECNS